MRRSAARDRQAPEYPVDPPRRRHPDETNAVFFALLERVEHCSGCRLRRQQHCESCVVAQCSRDLPA